jgi:hypothetical protein
MARPKNVTYEMKNPVDELSFGKAKFSFQSKEFSEATA